MKIQLDTTSKIIRIDETVNLGELHEMLEKFLPDGAWKQFKLEPTIIQKFHNPIVIDRWRPSFPYPWWHQPSIMYQGTTQSSTGLAQPGKTLTNQLNKGVYNLSID